MRAGEARQYAGQPGVAKILRHTEPHRSFKRYAAGDRHRLIVQLEDAPRVTQHNVARVGERESTSLPAKQRPADTLLELAHLQTDRGLRAPQAVRGLGETAEIHGHGKRPQHVHVEVGKLHDQNGFIYDPEYFNIARTDDLVLIQMTVSNTRTVEQKKALYRRITERLAKDPGLRPQDVFINLLEVVKENWSFGQGQAQYA